MKISQAFPSNYLKASDLDGRSIVVAMNKVVMEEIGSDEKPILYFEGKDKGMVLNKTNANTIAYAYGDDTAEWKGAKIELFTAMVDFQGKAVEAIRCRIPRTKPGNGNHTPERRDPPAARDLPDDDIPF